MDAHDALLCHEFDGTLDLHRWIERLALSSLEVINRVEIKVVKDSAITYNLSCTCMTKKR